MINLRIITMTIKLIKGYGTIISPTSSNLNTLRDLFIVKKQCTHLHGGYFSPKQKYLHTIITGDIHKTICLSTTDLARRGVLIKVEKNQLASIRLIFEVWACSNLQTSQGMGAFSRTVVYQDRIQNIQRLTSSQKQSSYP